MAHITKTPKIRQVVDFSIEDYQVLIELAEKENVGNPEVIRRAIKAMHREVFRTET